MATALDSFTDTDLKFGVEVAEADSLTAVLSAPVQEEPCLPVTQRLASVCPTN